jgi:hypothetical protein
MCPCHAIELNGSIVGALMRTSQGGDELEDMVSEKVVVQMMIKSFTVGVGHEGFVGWEYHVPLLLSFVSIQMRRLCGLRLPSDHQGLVVDV